MSQSDIFAPPQLTATISLLFNEPLVEDPNAKFQMFYSERWGTHEAEPVIDINGDKVYGDVLSDKLTFTIPIQIFPTEITVVALGLELAQWTKSEYVIFDAPSEYTHQLWIIAQVEEWYGPPGSDLDAGEPYVLIDPLAEPVDSSSQLGDNDLI